MIDDPEWPAFQAYCKKNAVVFAYVPGSVESAFAGWKQDNEKARIRAEHDAKHVKIVIKQKFEHMRPKLVASFEFNLEITHEELENAVKCISKLKYLQAETMKAITSIIALEKDFALIQGDFAAYRG